MLLGPFQQGRDASGEAAPGAIVPAAESAQVKQAEAVAQAKAQAQSAVAATPGAAIMRATMEEAAMADTEPELSTADEQAYYALEAACSASEHCRINRAQSDVFGRAAFAFTRIEAAINLCAKLYANARPQCRVPQINPDMFAAAMERLRAANAPAAKVHATLKALGELIPQERMHTLLPAVVFAIREFGKQLRNPDVALTLELDFYRSADLRDRAMDLIQGQLAEFRGGLKRETEIPWAAFAAFLWSVGDQEEALSALKREIAILETGTSRHFGRALASDKLLSSLNRRLQSWQRSMNCVSAVHQDGKDRVLVLSADCGT